MQRNLTSKEMHAVTESLLTPSVEALEAQGLLVVFLVKNKDNSCPDVIIGATDGVIADKAAEMLDIAAAGLRDRSANQMPSSQVGAA